MVTAGLQPREGARRRRNSYEIERPRGSRFHQSFPLLLVRARFCHKECQNLGQICNNMMSRWGPPENIYFSAGKDSEVSGETGQQIEQERSVESVFQYIPSMPLSSRKCSGSCRFVREWQWQKASCPIRITEFGIATRVKEVHFKKASPPMCVTELGIAKLAKELQLANAPSPI